MYTALRLQRKLKQELQRGRRARSSSSNPEPYMTYQPFLPEAAAGSISPRHVVVPLRRVLPQCRVVVGEGTRHRPRPTARATIATLAAGGGRATGAVEIPYDQLVLAPGSVSRTLPVPGLAEHGIGFKTVEEAIGLRNHVLEQLDIASSTRDPAVREAALTFVFVGGGYAGVEALAELEDMARYACRYYHNITAEDLRWVLVEATDRILPEVGEEHGRVRAARAARPQHRHTARTPGWTPARSGSPCSATATGCRPGPWCGRRASSRTPSWPPTGLPLNDARPARVRRRAAGGRRRRTSGRRATRPPYPT